MADNTPVYNDANSFAFAPHAKDKGATNASGKPIYQSQFGSDDGEQVTLGAKADATAALTAGALTGSFSLIALMRAVAGWALSPFVATVDARGTGTIASATANATYAIALQGGQGVVGLAVSGLTASGATLTVEAANNSGAFSAINAAFLLAGVPTLSQTLTADGNYRVNTGGHTAVQLRVSTTGTGTINVASSAAAAGGLVALSGALPAGEGHVGEFGGNVGRAQAQFGPTASTAYAAGQVISAPIALAGMARKAGGSGFVTSATLALNVANVVEVDLIVFSSLPSGTYTAGSAWTNTAADRPKIVGVLKVTDWTALSTTDSVGEVAPGAKFFTCDDATATSTLWVVPVTRGAITLAAATDATVTLRTSRN